MTQSKDILEQVETIGEAVDLAHQLGHTVDRANLVRYARLGRMDARKSKGTWLTTRDAVRKLVVSLENEARGRPQIPEVRVPQLAIKYRQTPELVKALERIQSARKQLRDQRLAPDREAKLWHELTSRAIYHTNHMEGNMLSLQEADAVIEAYKASLKSTPESMHVTTS